MDGAKVARCRADDERVTDSGAVAAGPGRLSERFRTFAVRLQDFPGSALEHAAIPPYRRAPTMRSRYRPLSGRARLIAAAAAAVVSSALLIAVAAGLTGGADAAQRWTAAPVASRHAVHPA
jgi:hypothetical protein